uniref:Uncharacterized protein n=1 Tax=Aegilops tauschii TaxID=37682 RepID=M8C656_AEGTA
MALARIMLSSTFSNRIEVHDTENKNVVLAVKILYIMVLCQGTLYLMACILESLSFLLRKSMALGCGLLDKFGVESVNLYYEQAYDTFLQEGLFNATKKMSLANFAIDSLNPKASRNRKCATVRILNSLLQKNKASSSNTELVSLITTSTKAVTTLISMLGWTITEDASIRIFAAKVMVYIAPYIQIVGIPGTMQKVYSLLDAQDQNTTNEVLTEIINANGGNADDQQISNDASSLTVNSNRRDVFRRQQTIHGSSNSKFDIERGKVPAVQISSTEMPQKKGERCCLMERVHRFSQHAEKLWSIPQEDSKDEDTLPALGMQILEGLAHDLHNCAVIIRVTDLLPKIIGLIRGIPGTMPTQRERTATSSLKLVAKLASVKGKIGLTLRQEFSKNPFLIGNLAEILELEGNSNYLEQSKLA